MVKSQQRIRKGKDPEVDTSLNKTLGRADPRANGAWLSKRTE